MMHTVLTTGSSTGLGEAAMCLFAAHGWSVAVTMRRFDTRVAVLSARESVG